jgi:hypothetical protein
MAAWLGGDGGGCGGRLAVMLALVVAAEAMPPGASAEVSVNVNIGPPPPAYMVAPAPTFVVVPGTIVYYAPTVGYNYFYYGGLYYTNHRGAWFYTKRHGGPWVFVAPARVPGPLLAVPAHYYKVPPGHLKKGGPPAWGHGHGKGKGD